jgi:acyl-CoA synthetase (AMP-forming)/AMP-acid ligase II
VDGGRWISDRTWGDRRPLTGLRSDAALSNFYHPPSTDCCLSNPLSLFPIALAAGGGSVDGVAATQWVAAGFTLLQRSATLVRSLALRRSAIFLPPSGAMLTALAASDGHGALLLPLDASEAEIVRWTELADVGAVFTNRALAPRVRVGSCAVVTLNDAPRTATVTHGGRQSAVDLGSHFALELEGEDDAGRDEECVISVADRGGDARGVVFTHRNLLALSRGAVDAVSLITGDHVLATIPFDSLASLALTFAAPLLAGARITSQPGFSAPDAVQVVERDDVALLVGAPDMFAAMADVIAARGTKLAAPALRVCACVGGIADAALQERWHAWAGHELRQAVGTGEAPLCLFNAPHFPIRRGTYGIPFPGMHVAVRDTNAGAPATTGELWVRGDQVSATSLPRTVAKPAAADGWLKTPLRVRTRADGAFEPA